MATCEPGCPEADDSGAERLVRSARGDDTADGVTAGQEDATVVSLPGRSAGQIRIGTLDQRAAAGWADIGGGCLR